MSSAMVAFYGLALTPCTRGKYKGAEPCLERPEGYERSPGVAGIGRPRAITEVTIKVALKYYGRVRVAKLMCAQ